MGSTTKGTTYVAQAFVRAEKPNTSVSLRLMEYDGRSFKGADRATVFLRDTEWHRLNVDYVARTNGSTIDVNVVGWDLPRGKAIYADKISVVSIKRVVANWPSTRRLRRRDGVSSGPTSSPARR